MRDNLEEEEGKDLEVELAAVGVVEAGVGEVEVPAVVAEAVVLAAVEVGLAGEAVAVVPAVVGTGLEKKVEAVIPVGGGADMEVEEVVAVDEVVQEVEAKEKHFQSLSDFYNSFYN